MPSSEFYSGLATYGDSLYHHGIKNQAWGVQNGPPYPLGSAGKARAAKARHILGGRKTREARLNEKAGSHATMANINRKLVESKLKGVEDKNSLAKAKTGQKIKNIENKDALAKTKSTSQLKSLENKQALNRARHKGKSARLQDKLEKQRYKTEMARLKKEQRNNEKKEEKPKEQKISAKDAARNALKERVINSGDPKMLKKYGRFLNNEEYKAAATRITMVNDLKSARLKAFVDRGRQLADTAKNVAETTRNAVDTANNAIKTVNFFRERAGLKPIRTIGQDLPKKETKSAQDVLNTIKAQVAAKEISNNPDKYRNSIMKQLVGYQAPDKATQVATRKSMLNSLNTLAGGNGSKTYKFRTTSSRSNKSGRSRFKVPKRK